MNVSLATRASSSRYGRISAAPSAQLRPTASGRAWRTEFQNASVVWPESVRPDASVIVPDTMIGERVEGHVACARIVDVGRDRRRAVGRSECAGDEARLVRRFRAPAVRTFAR